VLRELLKRDQLAVGIRNDQIEPALTAILFGGVWCDPGQCGRYGN